MPEKSALKNKIFHDPKAFEIITKITDLLSCQFTRSRSGYEADITRISAGGKYHDIDVNQVNKINSFLGSWSPWCGFVLHPCIYGFMLALEYCTANCGAMSLFLGALLNAMQYIVDRYEIFRTNVIGYDHSFITLIKKDNTERLLGNYKKSNSPSIFVMINGNKIQDSAVIFADPWRNFVYSKNTKGNPCDYQKGFTSEKFFAYTKEFHLRHCASEFPVFCDAIKEAYERGFIRINIFTIGYASFSWRKNKSAQSKLTALIKQCHDISDEAAPIQQYKKTSQVVDASVPPYKGRFFSFETMVDRVCDVKSSCSVM